MSQHISEVTAYTDGACDPNPGPGGWGVVLLFGTRIKELAGAEAATTNNRMELTAAIEALRALQRPCAVTVCTDSQYLRRGITEWVARWQRRGWVTARGMPVENQDLWQQLLAETQRHEVAWRWVKGHAGDPLNERADRLAREARWRLLAGQSAAPAGPGKRAHRAPEPDALQEADLYVHGCALGAPGPAGYAALLVQPEREPEIVSGGWPLASNNAMELWAAIAGLRKLERPTRVRVHTGSKYLLEGATRWLAGWEARGWRTASGRPVKNQDLWQELARAMGDHDVTWEGRTDGSLAQRVSREARACAETAREERLEGSRS